MVGLGLSMAQNGLVSKTRRWYDWICMHFHPHVPPTPLSPFLPSLSVAGCILVLQESASSEIGDASMSP